MGGRLREYLPRLKRGFLLNSFQQDCPRHNAIPGTSVHQGALDDTRQKLRRQQRQRTVRNVVNLLSLPAHLDWRFETPDG